MARRGRRRKKQGFARYVIAALVAVALFGAWFVHGWTGAGPLKTPCAFTVPPGSTLGSGRPEPPRVDMFDPSPFVGEGFFVSAISRACRVSRQ